MHSSSERKYNVRVFRIYPQHLSYFQIGGQCDCKSNVDNNTRACDQCKFNTANITSGDVDGCTACACISDGITQCMDDLTCQCKANVERDSGRCSKCLPNFYGIEDSNGCMPCGCNEVGTNEARLGTCDMTTGQCTCKKYAQGMTEFVDTIANFKRDALALMNTARTAFFILLLQVFCLS